MAVKNKRKKSSNSLVLGIGVLVALSILGGYFIGVHKADIKESTKETVQPVEDPTADWSTYSDTNHKFSIKYPQDWKIGNSATSGTLVTFDGPISGELEPGEGPPFIGILPVENGLSVQEQIAGYGSTDYKNVSIDGQEFILFLYTYQLGTSGIANKTKSIEVLSQMASTMKPLNSLY